MSKPTDVAKKVPTTLWIFIGFFVMYMLSRIIKN